MINKLKTFLLVTFGFMPLALVAVPAVTYADTQSQIQSGVNQAAGQDQSATDPSKDLSNTIKKILNIMSAIAGVAAVIILIVAGLRFVASAGSENAVKGAKSAIVYAIIGLVIVALAQVVVHFVISNVATASGSSSSSSSSSSSTSSGSSGSGSTGRGPGPTQ